MKEVTAIIQPFMLSKVAWALQKLDNLPGMTVTKVQGFGRGKAKGVLHRIVEDLIDYVPKVKIELVVNDDMAEEVVQTILKNAHTGNKGDGKIFVRELKNVIRIRTGEEGELGV
jgi:nitrogen regulatory protein P-II 1